MKNPLRTLLKELFLGILMPFRVQFRSKKSRADWKNANFRCMYGSGESDSSFYRPTKPVTFNKAGG